MLSSTCCDSESLPDVGKLALNVGSAPVPSIWDDRDTAAAANKKRSLNITQFDPSDSNFGILVKNSNTLPFAVDIVDSVETVDGFANVNY